MATSVINIARGGQPYRRAHINIAQALLAQGDNASLQLNKFTRDSLFKLKKETWFVLGFVAKDWPILNKLRAGVDLRIERAYLQLLVDYVTANKERVNGLYETERKISASFLTDDGADIIDLIQSHDEVDKQSLFVFRVLATSHAHSHDDLITYFKHQLNTDWLRQRFLYPFVYYTINVPADSGLDDFLSYVIPDYRPEDSQTATIKFLLRDEAMNAEGLAFKSYIALLCHPYDACEILLNHIEMEFVKTGTLPTWLSTALESVAEQISGGRISRVLRMVRRNHYSFRNNVSAAYLEQEFGVDAATAGFYARQHEATCDIDVPESTGRMKPHIERMRRSRYPTISDFNIATSAARQWGFTEGGRFLSAYFSSLYLFPRRDHCFEVRDVLRSLGFTGSVTEFLINSPGGEQCFSRGLTSYNPVAARNLIQGLGEKIREPKETLDRSWIKSAHYKLQRAQEQLRIKTWLSLVREHIPVAPLPYISGIDWSFVTEVIQKMRIAPFENDVNGVYALLLMQLEDASNDGTILRTAIEPFAEGLTLAQFCSRLINEYCHDANAFVRYFLNPEQILLLGLAPNHVAALDGRIKALVDCVRTFNFNTLITSEQFQQESRLLTATIHRRRADAEKVEIAWGVFRRDVLEKEKDSYDTYVSLKETHLNRPPLLSDAKLVSPHRFRNGKVVKYEFRNRDWPLLMLVVSVIDAFTHHPGIGLEVTLSQRFRHDTLQREFEDVFERAKSDFMPGILKVSQGKIVAHFEDPLLEIIRAWMAKYIHSVRPGRDTALFDLAPDQDEMKKLLESLSDLPHFPAVVDTLVDWMQAKLNLQLASAEEKFEGELAQSLECKVAERRDELTFLGNLRASDVIRVASAINSGLQRKIDHLKSWFSVQNVAMRVPLTIGEVKWAVDGVFETQLNSERLEVVMHSGALGGLILRPTQIRMLFDLLSEVYNNCLKNNPEKGHIRIWSSPGPGFAVMHFSSPAPTAAKREFEIQGKRYESLDDSIFREGNSGLQKIAALAASLNGRDCSIRVKRSEKAFHLSIPIEFPHSEAVDAA